MKGLHKTIFLLCSSVFANSAFAQTLQTVTNSGATTTNVITVGGLISNSASLVGAALPTNISSLNGLRLNGSISDNSFNGITYHSLGGGGAAIAFSRGGSYDTNLDFFTNTYSGGSYNMSHRMRINSVGYVGIGTASPQQNFVVSNNGQEGFEVYLNQPSGTVGLQAYNRTTGVYANMRYEASQHSFLVGNVGIGTLYPTEKLSVKGKIRAQEIKVEAANWPDFVFAKNYELPSLKEIENHIKQNGHLHGIPSAAEVAKDGIELGEMNKKLLQKIEELTLYLIEKDKEVKSLQSLKSKIDDLETKITLLINQ
ncbi:MAG: hypothetical protein V4594_17865 [Bacteroidota bacterium]